MSRPHASVVPALLASLLLVALPAAAMPGADQAAPAAMLRGTVVDASGAAIVGAIVTVTPAVPGGEVATDLRGEFAVAAAPGEYTVTVTADGFLARAVVMRAGPPPAAPATVALDLAGLHETVRVEAAGGYEVGAITSATRTATPLRDVPQAVSVVARDLIADQRMTGMADVVRYMPGVGIAQGEGNRDTPILRGNSTTSDFFVDGVRDDVQYVRDIYNVERVEALKGPNAMIFGRGGVGGVINRVTRQADWGASREIALQAGSWDNRRITADLGRGLSRSVAVRVTGLYEDSGSYREGVGVERHGVNPTLALRLGPATTLRAGYEYFHDERTADRGVSSFAGRPIETDPSTFFGDPAQSPVRATINLLATTIEHRFNAHVSLRNRTSFGDYDKFYQNVFPGAANAAGTMVSIGAYNNATRRSNLFNQTDVTVTARTGRIGHTILAGTELGRQDTTNVRHTGYFTSLGANVTSMAVPVSAPTISAPLTFRPGTSDADNHSVATIGAVYAQDQMTLSRHLQAVVGLRFDRFQVDVRNNRTGAVFAGDDGLVSPRLALIYKPIEPVSVYGSYSLSYLPRAGEQLTSLSLSNQALDPEEFRNYEVGAKWDLRPALALTAAVYQLDRGNVVVPDPDDPAVSRLVDAQRSRGLEIGLNGAITRAWSVAGGYARQHGEITRSISASAQAGARLAQLPAHAFSLWNRYQPTARVGLGLGVIHRGAVFASTDNAVVLPRFTRVDSALFVDLTPAVRAQLNVENLFDARYYAFAHSNTNITPGSPRALRVSLVTRF